LLLLLLLFCSYTCYAGYINKIFGGTGSSRYDKQLCIPKSFVCEAFSVMSSMQMLLSRETS